jgi:prepilin-type processing-associated H-X9-DG protein
MRETRDAHLAGTNPSCLRTLDYAAPSRNAPRANPFALAGFTCAILACGILFFGFGYVSWHYQPLIESLVGLLTLLAIVFSIIGNVKHVHQPTTRGGVLAFLGLLIGIALFLFSCLLPTGGHPREPGNRVKCASNLRQIGQGMMLYADDCGGRSPADLGLLIIQADLNPEVFVCPSSNDTKATGSTTQQAASLSTPGFCSYVYLGAGLKIPASPSLIIAYEPLAHHGNDGINVLYGDGNVAWIKRKEAERIIKELKAGHNPPRAVGTGN